MNRALALVLLCSPLLGSETPRTAARLKPDLAPTAAAAAELVGQEAAAALSGRGATAALVVKGRRVASAVSDAFVAALVRAGIEARCGSAPLFPSLKPRHGPPLVRFDCTRSDGERRVTVSLPAPFGLTFEQRHGDAPWVVAADAAVGEQGVALLPDGDSGQRCVGRSDPCSSLSEASAEARSRLERSVQTAALAALATQGRQRAAPRGLLRRVLEQAGVETFAQQFARPYGTMHRAYATCRLSDRDLAVLTWRSARDRLPRYLVWWLQAGAMVAVTGMVWVACRLAIGRREGLIAWLIRFAGCLAWAGLVALFAVVL